MALPGNSFTSPRFVKAATAEGLRKKMLENNIRNGRQYKYRDIQFSKGAWYAWYDETEKLEELMNKGNRNESKKGR